MDLSPAPLSSFSRLFRPLICLALTLPVLSACLSNDAGSLSGNVTKPAPAAPVNHPNVNVAKHELVVPSGFDATQVTNDGPSVPSPIQGPTKMAIASDGRIFVAEHFGRVRIIKNDAVLQTPFLTIPDANIDRNSSRGLMGIALDPSFTTNGYVYVHYTRKISATVSRNRIGRYKASAANPDRADVDGTGAPIETLIFDMSDQGSSTAHNSMPMVFGSDGKLWVATGDNYVPANAQITTHTSGKLLRMNADGTPATGNPLFNNANAVEKRLWAKGLRNPWSIARDPSTGRIFFNDVGSTEAGTPDPNHQPWEESNAVPTTTTTLLDYGWPNNEGVGSNLAYRYANGAGDDGVDCSIVGAAFYRSSGAAYSFSATYDGSFFFGDHCSGWIRYLPSNKQTPGQYTTNTPLTFGTSLNAALIDLQVHPDGSLYYLARAAVARDHAAPGIIGRIRPITVPVPTISISAPLDGDRFNAPATFTVIANAGGPNPITKVEFFSNDVKQGEDTSSPFEWPVTGLGQGSYRFTVRATNNLGGSKDSDAITVTVNGPTAVIDTPTAGSTFVAGTPVTFSGSATDPEDGTLDVSRLEWNVMLHHNSHVHPAAGPFVGVTGGTFTPDPNDEVDHDVWYGVYLTATDSAGIRHTTRRDVLPIKSTLTLASNPTGLKIDLDNSPQTTPFSFLAVAGVHRLLDASYYQVMPGNGPSGGLFYQFTGWSDGGPRSRTITTPSTNTTYTANYNPVSWTNINIGTTTAGSLALSSGVFTLRASGADIESTSDGFQFGYQSVTGNVTITARVTGVQNTNPWAKAGVMLRNGTTANAVNVMAFVSPTATNKFRFQYRPTAGAVTTSVASTANSAVPAYVRLTRVGNVFTSFYSTDNITYTQIGSQTITMGTTILAGLAATSHVNGTIGTYTFDNVSITGVGPAVTTPPAAPSALSANGGAGQATLSWIDSANSETGFRIERKLAADPDSSYAEITTVGSNVTSYINSMIAAGTYSYRVRAYNSGGNSGYSNSANATVTPPPQPPAAPSGLAATGAVGQASLSWVDNAGDETSFKIERKLTSQADTSYAQIATVGANVVTYSNTSVPAGAYSYRVRANNAVGDSAFSNVATATVTAPPPPSAPSGLVATGGVGQATLDWVDTAGDETGFKIERKLTSQADTSYAQIATVGANVVTYSNTSLAAGAYSYRVRANNTAGDSAYSNVATATVTAPPPPSAPSGLVATGGSGQATLNWVDNASNETGFKIERKLTSQADTSYAQIATAGANVVTYTNTSVAAGTYTYRVRANNANGDSAYSNAANATITAPPPTWTSQDIGAVAAAGSHTETSGTFSVKGSGADIWNTLDEFRFVHRTITSTNVTIVARLTSISNTDPFAKAGIMIRNGTASNAANIMMLVTPTFANGYRLQQRLTAGAVTTSARSTPNGVAPVWVRLVRSGNTFTGFYSTSTSLTPPTTWTQVGAAQTITMGSSVQVGIAVTSHLDGTIATGGFTGVTITTP
jgi:glucose/arabinose dehydrogenase